MSSPPTRAGSGSESGSPSSFPRKPPKPKQQPQPSEGSVLPCSPSSAVSAYDISPIPDTRTAGTSRSGLLSPSQRRFSQIPSVSSEKVKTINMSRVALIRQTYMADCVHTRFGEYTSAATLRIFAGTWNVNAKIEDQGRLTDWLNCELQDRCTDIVAIGLQEMISLSATNVVAGTVVDSQSKDKAIAWQQALLTTLDELGRHSNTKFEPIAHVHMVGIFLCLFARSDLLPTMTDVQVTQIPTGAGGLLGNKGACCIRLKCLDTSICFVSAHLTAHRGAVAARAEDIKTISTKPVFFDSVLPQSQLGRGTKQSAASRIIGSAAEKYMASTASSVARHGKFEGEQVRARLRAFEADHNVHCVAREAVFTVLDHDLIVWVGDLNYRLHEDLELEEAYDMLETNRIDELRQFDQLTIERHRLRIFEDFDEGEIQFPPTYKFIPGEGIYDRRPEKKMRCPAWCDRVLWKIGCSESVEKVKLIQYKCSETNIVSDHKPVSAVLDVTLNCTDYDRQRKVLNEICRSCENFINQNCAIVTTSTSQLWFTGVKESSQHETTVYLRNDGQVAASFEFDLASVPQWLHVDPLEGSIECGDAFPVIFNVNAREAFSTNSSFLSALIVCSVPQSDDLLLPVCLSLTRTVDDHVG